MHPEFEALTKEAQSILNNVWNLGPGRHAFVASRWLRSVEGHEALAAFCVEMNSAASESAKQLVRDIFATRVEIASRHACWSVEMEAPMLTDKELSTYC